MADGFSGKLPRELLDSFIAIADCPDVPKFRTLTEFVRCAVNYKFHQQKMAIVAVKGTSRGGTRSVHPSPCFTLPSVMESAILSAATNIHSTPNEFVTMSVRELLADI